MWCLSDPQAPDVSLVLLYQRLVLKNMSSLNLSLKLTLREPFALCAYEGDELFKTSKVNSLTHYSVNVVMAV